MIARLSRLGLPVALALAVLAWSATPASAVEFNFFNLTNNGSPDVGDQLSVEVSQIGTNVCFYFTNDVGIASSITDIYFDDNTGVLSLPVVITQSSGVDFSAGASPGNLPGGNEATPDFEATAGLTADSNPPTQQNGVNSSSEWLQLCYGGTLASVLQALGSGDLRIGLHIQGFADGGSDSYINNPNPIPEPSTMAIAGLGALGFVGYGLRRRRSK
jgi:hypothetical protein